MEVLMEYKNLKGLLEDDSIDGMAEIFDDIVGFYYSHFPDATMDWVDAKQPIEKDATALLRKYEGNTFAHDLVLATYRELRGNVKWNMKARAGKC
jgi:hypothetical protein